MGGASIADFESSDLSEYKDGSVYGTNVSKYNLKAPKVSKEILIGDLQAMERGDLGLTESEQDQIIDKSAEQQRAMLNAQNAIAARQAMGGVPGVSSGQQMDKQRKDAESLAQTSAFAASNAAQMSKALAEAKRQEILARLEGQQDRRRENTMFAMEQWQKHSQAAAETASLAAWSDIRLKRDIELIGKSPSGINIYRFQYKVADGFYTGAMAQELLESHPEAVIQSPTGFYAVRYDLIDVDFREEQ